MKNAVRNLIALSAPAPASVDAARAAILALAQAKDPAGAGTDATGRVFFTIEWEPAFKEVKELSKQFSGVTFTLYGDAFAKQHWISKTTYESGKTGEDTTVSRIDGDAFRRIYQEVFGQPFPVGG
jgi:hypothetical protein